MLGLFPSHSEKYFPLPTVPQNFPPTRSAKLSHRSRSAPAYPKHSAPANPVHPHTPATISTQAYGGYFSGKLPAHPMTTAEYFPLSMGWLPALLPASRKFLVTRMALLHSPLLSKEGAWGRL